MLDTPPGLDDDDAASTSVAGIHILSGKSVALKSRLALSN